MAAIASPALAADWSEDWGEDDMRGAYSNEPKDWSGYGDENDSLHFEAGLRYWYSIGSQSFEALGQSFDNSDTSHMVEAHLRIDDDLSRTYVKGVAGYSAVIAGSFEDDVDPSGEIADGHVGYAGADVGWNLLGDGEGSGLGGFIGYQFWNDSPRTSRLSFTTATSSADVSYDQNTGEVSLPFDSVDNNLDINALRLGFSGRAKFADGMFDITGEVAAVPYATISGVIGGSGFDPEMTTPLGNYSFVKSSATEIDGTGYGAMAELMLGFKPMDNLTLRLGGRAWYLQGTADSTFSAISLSDPTDSNTDEPPNYDTAPGVTNQQYIDVAEPFSLLRYGILAELTYSF